MEAPSTQSLLQCIVVTPERAVLDETCDFVALPMYDGELGVLPGRPPLIGRLGFRELRVVRGPVVHRYYLDGGFVQIRGNVVTVLTSKAVRAQDIKVPTVEGSLREGARIATTPEAQEAALKNQQRLRAQLRVARHAGDATPAAAGH